MLKQAHRKRVSPDAQGSKPPHLGQQFSSRATLRIPPTLRSSVAQREAGSQAAVAAELVDELPHGRVDARHRQRQRQRDQRVQEPALHTRQPRAHHRLWRAAPLIATYSGHHTLKALRRARRCPLNLNLIEFKVNIFFVFL